MRFPLVLSISLLSTSVLAQTAVRGPISVGPVAAAPGTKASGGLLVPSGRLGATVDPGTTIPVTIVHGREPGPVLALIAGTHGYEYTSILALPRVVERLDPTRMKGSVILVHMANPLTFYGRRIYFSPDGKNLNRVYPGKEDGTISERIAFAITNEVIDKSTHVIDMHCGDGNESLRPYSYWMTGTDPRVDEQSKELNLAFGLDYIVIDTERPKDVKDSRYTAMTGILRGKPSITVESGGMGMTDEPSIKAQVDGALSVVNHLGIQAQPSVRVQKPVWIDKSEVLTSPATGVWMPVVDQKANVAAGSLIGRVHDPFGAVLAEIKAPFAGEMMYVVRTPPVTAGEPLAYVGRIRTDGK